MLLTFSSARHYSDTLTYVEYELVVRDEIVLEEELLRLMKSGGFGWSVHNTSEV